MLLATKKEYPSKITHATLITKVSKDDIYYTAHTAPQKNQSLWKMVKKGYVTACYIIILKEGAK